MMMHRNIDTQARLLNYYKVPTVELLGKLCAGHAGSI
jgi:hypothetical protein